MWSRVINPRILVDFNIQLGAKVQDSRHNELGNFLLGVRKENYVFKLDKMVLSYLTTKNLLIKMSAAGSGNFLFTTTRPEYYPVIEGNASFCNEEAFLWDSREFTNKKIKSQRFIPMTNDEPFMPLKLFTTVILLFDNDRFRTNRLLHEADFQNLPVITVLDTDSLFSAKVFPMFGNDESTLSTYFYSFFTAICLKSKLSRRSLFNDDILDDSA